MYFSNKISRYILNLNKQRAPLFLTSHYVLLVLSLNRLYTITNRRKNGNEKKDILMTEYFITCWVSHLELYDLNCAPFVLC